MKFSTLTLVEKELVKGQRTSVSRSISAKLTSRTAAKHSSAMHTTVKVKNVSLLTARCVLPCRCSHFC